VHAYLLLKIKETFMKLFTAFIFSVLSLNLSAVPAGAPSLMSYDDGAGQVTYTTEPEYDGEKGLVGRYKIYMDAREAWYTNKSDKTKATLEKADEKYANKLDVISEASNINPVVILLALAELDILTEQYYYGKFLNLTFKDDTEKKKMDKDIKKDLAEIGDFYEAYKKSFSDKLRVFNTKQKTDPADVIVKAVDEKLKKVLEGIRPIPTSSAGDIKKTK